MNKVGISPPVPLIPPWEHLRAHFDTNYTDLTKNDNPNLLVNIVKEHLDTNYGYDLKIFTDGSVLETNDCGCGFVIPDLRIEKSFYIGKNLSIFTCELYAIMMALELICNTSIDLYSIVVCVDSKSVLSSLQSWTSNCRRDLLYEIRFLVHCIKSRGINVTFCWVPSHLGLYWNEVSDKLAKKGSSKSDNTHINEIHLSKHEYYSMINKFMYKGLNKCHTPTVSRNIASLIYKFKLNTWKTKFCKSVNCICDQKFSICHAIFDCPKLKVLYDRHNLVITEMDLNTFLNSENLYSVASIILQSKLRHIL